MGWTKGPPRVFYALHAERRQHRASQVFVGEGGHRAPVHSQITPLRARQPTACRARVLRIVGPGAATLGRRPPRDGLRAGRRPRGRCASSRRRPQRAGRSPRADRRRSRADRRDAAGRGRRDHLARRARAGRCRRCHRCTHGERSVRPERLRRRRSSAPRRRGSSLRDGATGSLCARLSHVPARRPDM